MNNTRKYDFIKELLGDRTINHHLRERILELASKEIWFEGTKARPAQDVEKGVVDESDEKANLKPKGNKGVSDSEPQFIKRKKPGMANEHSKNIKLHSPKKLVEWLKLFTLHNSILKFSTHLWDESGLFSEFDDFVKRLEGEWIKHDIFKLKEYNSNLYWNKLYPFLFQKKLTSIQKKNNKFGWGRHNIRIGWQYPGLIKQWCASNYDHKGVDAILPFSMEIPTDLRPSNPISGKTIVSFEDVVDVFKKEIEFRDNDLFIEIKTLIKKILPNHDIDCSLLENLKGRSFYTNTEYVIKAISRIFMMIKSRSESNRVQISCNYNEDHQEYDLQIIHVNSFADKELNHPKLLLREDYGDLYILRTTLRSLCDFSITSRFKDRHNKLVNARIEYLYEGVHHNNWKPKIEEIPKSVEGFQFNLKFLVT